MSNSWIHNSFKSFKWFNPFKPLAEVLKQKKIVPCF
jgi:hypothetical protein